MENASGSSRRGSKAMARSVDRVAGSPETFSPDQGLPADSAGDQGAI